MEARRKKAKALRVRFAEHMDTLVAHLLGSPNKALSRAGQLRFGNKGSLAIEIDGEKAGSWFDHEGGIGGGPLDLVTHRLGLQNGAACDWAREWLGLNTPYYRGDKQEKSPTQTFATPTAAPTSTNGASHAHKPQKDEPRKEPTPQERAEKVSSIVSACTSCEGTPAEFYLSRRGITALPPDSSVRFRPHACGGYGALVAVATDADGNVLAVQQIYLTSDGQKAPVDIQKRTNKAVEGWANKSAVRFPGKSPIVLAEGVETALSIWQATGQETWACLGISNIGIMDKIVWLEVV